MNGTTRLFRQCDWRLLATLIGLASLNATIYLVVAQRAGLPLDDAWIHQVFARNIGLHGEIAFNPGQPSSGSTALGWSMLLALSYLLRLSPIPWAYACGSLFAVASAFLATRLGERYFGSLSSPWLVGILCLLEWHLAWAAMSGMEITLFTFLALICGCWIARGVRHGWDWLRG